MRNSRVGLQEEMTPVAKGVKTRGIGAAGFEPATSWSQIRPPRLKSTHPACFVADSRAPCSLCQANHAQVARPTSQRSSPS